MAMKWRDKNFGKSPFDPDYDDTYDRMQDYEDFCTALEEREEQREEK